MSSAKWRPFCFNLNLSNLAERRVLLRLLKARVPLTSSFMQDKIVSFKQNYLSSHNHTFWSKADSFILLELRLVLRYCACCNLRTLYQLQWWLRMKMISWCQSFGWHGLAFIPAWISNHTPNKVHDEITYPFQNFAPLKFGNGYVISIHTF